MPKLTIAVFTTAPFAASEPTYLRPRPITKLLTTVVLIGLLAAPSSQAQQVGASPFVMLGSEGEERARLAQLLGSSSPSGFLLRSPSQLSAAAFPVSGWSVGLIGPIAHAVHNSGLPFSLNDGPLWASRGWNEDVTIGIAITAGSFRLIAAPTVINEENHAFQVIPFPQNAPEARSVWANPFHPLPESIDLPIRFGDRRRQRLDPGQSSATLDVRGVSIGVATQNLWWGPGIRNAITLSNNAAGFPHAFVQTRGPLRTRAGTFNGQWILGQLTESDFFDRDTANNVRSLSGAAFTWSPPSDSGLTLGAARIVIAPGARGGVPVGAAFDVLRTVGHPYTDTLASASGRDQLTSVFGRWVFPESGLEAYAEWARFEEPKSFRDYIEYPGHSEGYTLGLQWAHPYAPLGAFQLQTEASYLEPDPSLRLRPVATTYTSRTVPQGFTNRGQTLGAATGPGSSSQWLAADLFAQRWRAGAYLGRIRWDNGVLFEPIVPQFKRQDVTLYAGLRGSASWRGVNLMVDFSHGARFNYLFQAYTLGAVKTGGIDLINNTLSITLSTAGAW
jgi:hypothetical protein